MSSPTSYYQPSSTFRPSRPAPPPPIYSLYAQTPQQQSAPHGQSHSTSSYRSQSTGSLDSFSTLYTPEHVSVGVSRHTSPTSPLNTPLSTPKSARRTYSYPLTIPTSPSSPTSSDGQRAVYYSTIHSDLGLFDNRGRQNLLGDIECIIGKKLHFPFLSSKKEKSSTKTVKSGSIVKPKMGHSKSGSSGSGSSESNKLKREKRISDDDLFWSGLSPREKEEVVIIGSEAKRGRGVREGNWI